ncbi:MAG: SprT-like domain-containing protein [Gemmatimonadota bacterium]
MRARLGVRWRTSDQETGRDPAHAPTRGARPPIRITLPEEVLLARRLEALGLKDLRSVRVTDNRSVMVSLSPRRVLSIHRGYAQAPDRVLKAVVRFLKPGTRRETRRAAEHQILSFKAEEHVAGPPRRRWSAERARPGDLEKLVRLRHLFADCNARHFGGTLPELPIRISGRMSIRLGQLGLRHGSRRPFELTISRRHIDRHGWEEAAHTLLHEMVHLWQHENGIEVDHGPRFRRKASEVGVVPSARRRVRAPQGRAGVARTD